MRTAILLLALLLWPVVGLAQPYSGHGTGVTTSRAVNTTSPLGGGGALSADLTLTCTLCVVGPASATDNAAVRYDATTGKLVQDSGVIINDSANHTFTSTGQTLGASSGSYHQQQAAANVGIWLRSAHTTSTATAGVRLNGNGSSFSASSGTQTGVLIDPDVNETGTATFDVLRLAPTLTGVGSGGVDVISVAPGGTEVFRVTSAGATDVDSTITAGGTTGNQTINKPAGTVNVAAAGTTITVTNSLVTANSFLSVMARTNDATCSVKNYVPAAGSVVINMTAACTAETSVHFEILDKN